MPEPNDDVFDRDEQDCSDQKGLTVAATAVSASDKCRHCSHRAQLPGRRGLCSACYNSTPIRSLYPKARPGPKGDDWDEDLERRNDMAGTATKTAQAARDAVHPEPTEDEVALRVWKRDATKNYVYLKHAIANLAGRLEMTPQAVADAFRGGEMLETPLALWRMATLED